MRDIEELEELEEWFEEMSEREGGERYEPYFDIELFAWRHMDELIAVAKAVIQCQKANVLPSHPLIDDVYTAIKELKTSLL